MCLAKLPSSLLWSPRLRSMCGFLQALTKPQKLSSYGHAVVFSCLSPALGTHRDDLDKHQDPAGMRAYVCGGESSLGNRGLPFWADGQVTFEIPRVSGWVRLRRTPTTRHHVIGSMTPQRSACYRSAAVQARQLSRSFNYPRERPLSRATFGRAL